MDGLLSLLKQISEGEGPCPSNNRAVDEIPGRTDGNEGDATSTQGRGLTGSSMWSGTCGWDEHVVAASSQQEVLLCCIVCTG